MKEKTPHYCIGSASVLASQQRCAQKDIQKDEHWYETFSESIASPLKRTVTRINLQYFISGEEFRSKSKPPLGGNIRNVPGVHGSYSRTGSLSSPIIRGLDGPTYKSGAKCLEHQDACKGWDQTIKWPQNLTAVKLRYFRGPATFYWKRMQ